MNSHNFFEKAGKAEFLPAIELMNFILSTGSNTSEELKDLDQKMKVNSARIWKQSYVNSQNYLKVN